MYRVMRTIIELYDERPIENVLGTEVFRPEETVIICPPEVEADHVYRKSLQKYFEHRGISVRLTFVSVSLLNAGKIEKKLRQVLETHPESAIDISGGTDAALFAAGEVASTMGDIPVYTYSRKKNSFFEIKNAPFARDLPCRVRLDAESCFLMAGGTLLPGREDNEKLKTMLPEMEKLFDIFLKYRRVWNRQINYIQKISSSLPGELQAEGHLTEKADRGTVTADQGLLQALAQAELIHDLTFEEDRVRFSFPDEMIRFWLRDIGAVLELQVFRACLDCECFDDVVLSAVVNWQGNEKMRDAVTNEIDVMAVQGIQPVFISCKTSEIKTGALNELAVLRDRFGGKGSRALIVTSSFQGKGLAPMRKRASELGIEVIEAEDPSLERLKARLSGI